jgi:hypothetical protein
MGKKTPDKVYFTIEWQVPAENSIGGQPIWVSLNDKDGKEFLTSSSEEVLSVLSTLRNTSPGEQFRAVKIERYIIA